MLNPKHSTWCWFLKHVYQVHWNQPQRRDQNRSWVPSLYADFHSPVLWLWRAYSDTVHTLIGRGVERGVLWLWRSYSRQLVRRAYGGGGSRAWRRRQSMWRRRIPVQTVQQAITAATAARAEKVTCACVCDCICVFVCVCVCVHTCKCVLCVWVWVGVCT